VITLPKHIAVPLDMVVPMSMARRGLSDPALGDYQPWRQFAIEPSAAVPPLRRPHSATQDSLFAPEPPSRRLRRRIDAAASDPEMQYLLRRFADFGDMLGLPS
jgi:hypothetical protein